MKKEKKPLDWKSFGAFVSKMVSLFALIRDTFAGMGVGIEIVPWVITDGKAQFVEALQALGAEYQKATVPTVSEPPRSWREEGDVIYFSVTSDGTTGESWITRLERKGVHLEVAKQIIRNPCFTPTKGVTFQIAVLKGKIWSDRNRLTSTIRAEATRRGWQKPPAEVACLIREKFTDAQIEAMGLLWIITMHEPIEDSGRDPRVLGTSRFDSGSWLRAYNGDSGTSWYRGHGFAFVASSTQDSVTPT